MKPKTAQDPKSNFITVGSYKLQHLYILRHFSTVRPWPPSLICAVLEPQEGTEPIILSWFFMLYHPWPHTCIQYLKMITVHKTNVHKSTTLLFQSCLKRCENCFPSICCIIRIKRVDMYVPGSHMRNYRQQSVPTNFWEQCSNRTLMH